MSVILAIDPGSEQSAFLLYSSEGGRIIDMGIVPNIEMLATIDRILGVNDIRGYCADECVIEMVASYGMAVGREVFETVFWIGRFAERWDRRREANPRPAQRLFRRDVKLHLCHSARATDANIREALLDRYGPGKEKAVGRKAAPGPLFGVSKDIWSALANAVTVAERITSAPPDIATTKPSNGGAA